jgi:hypothetical protein
MTYASWAIAFTAVDLPVADIPVIWTRFIRCSTLVVVGDYELGSLSPAAVNRAFTALL